MDTPRNIDPISPIALKANRVSSDTKRAKFTAAEVVWLTLEFYRRNYIEGLFYV